MAEAGSEGQGSHHRDEDAVSLHPAGSRFTGVSQTSKDGSG